MAANVNITPGSGDVVAAEDISSVKYQKIKVVDGTAASTNLWKVNSDGSAQVSILGTPTVSFSGSPSISGAVTVVGNPSISGTVNIGTQSGSVVGFQGGTRIISGSVLSYMAPLASLVSGVTSVITSTSITAVLPAAPGGQRNYITHITATNGAATGTFVDIRDGTTVIYSGYAAASGGGFAASFPTPLKQSSISAVVDMQASAQASVKVAIIGFTA